MNRRGFFKTVTAFAAGVCAAFVPKAKANLRDFDAHLILGDDFDEVDLMTDTLSDKEISRMCNTIENPREKLVCKDCYRECRHWDECIAFLRKRVYFFPTTHSFSKSRFTPLVSTNNLS